MLLLKHKVKVNNNMPKKPNGKKGGRSQMDSDDSSVDAKGNVRNLIDYDYDEISADSDSSSEQSVIANRIMERPKRAAAIKANRRIRRLSESSSDESFVPEKPVKKGGLKQKKTKPVTKTKGKAKQVAKMDTEEEEEDEDLDNEEELEEEEDDDDYSDSESSKASGLGQRIGLMISGFGKEAADPNKPKKYKMKDEPVIVQKFVKLVQKGNSNDDQEKSIDTDITYFKKLPEKKQTQIIEKMERKFSMDEEEVPLKFKLLEKQVPQAIEKIAMSKYNALMNIDSSTNEYYKCYHWVEGYSNIPIGIYRDLPVKLEDGTQKCADFVSEVRKNMDKAIYGQEDSKLQILQFVSNWIANPVGAGNVLSIYGPMGVGKTTLVKQGVAKALDRPFHFISLGGATDASYLDGHSYTYEGSTWGRIADILIQSKCMNPIIYFDELDKVSETAKGDEIMNLLIHITDGSQNDRFQDKYFSGIDLDLSRCLFIFSHNNHEKINPILRDRMYNIRVEGFTLKEKLVIAEQYLIPEAMGAVGLFEKISFQKDVIEYIIENFTGQEKGVRELKRCVQTIMSKLNLLRFYNDKKLVPFAIEGFALPFILKRTHIDIFLKKKEDENDINPSLAGIYT